VDKERLTKELLESWKVPSEKTKAEAWEAIQVRIDTQQLAPKAKIVSMRRFAWTAVAAACVALAVFAIWPREEWVEFAQIQKGNEAIELPDGSQIWLNADSKLRYEKNEWSSMRTVYLSGEAYFEVEKGSKFSVTTSEGIVSVLGTSFNVYDRLNELEVECYTGSVGVEVSEDELVLYPGEGALVESGDLSSPFAIETTGPEWKEGYYRFRNEDATRIFDELERQFGCTIEVPTGLDKRSTCEFDCLNLNQALTIVCLSMDLGFEIGKNLKVSIWETKEMAQP
jgi:transmembrane sensor